MGKSGIGSWGFYDLTSEIKLLLLLAVSDSFYVALIYAHLPRVYDSKVILSSDWSLFYVVVICNQVGE